MEECEKTLECAMLHAQGRNLLPMRDENKPVKKIIVAAHQKHLYLNLPLAEWALSGRDQLYSADTFLGNHRKLLPSCVFSQNHKHCFKIYI